MHHNHNQKLLKDKMPMMMSCDEAAYFISKNQHKKLGFIKWVQLKMHLLMCVYCRIYEKQIQYISKIINKLKSHPENNQFNLNLNTSQREKIQSQIDKAS